MAQVVPTRPDDALRTATSIQTADRPADVTALVVNGDSSLRSSYVSMFRANAFLTEESSDGRVALAKAIVQRPDVVVTETRLVGIDGYQLCTLLRRDPDTCGAAIVVVTEDSEPDEIERALAAGADTVLLQPCPSERLLAEAQRLLESRDRETAQSGRPLRRPAKATLAGGEAVRPPGARSAPPNLGPPATPPELLCPECLSPLVFERSHVGGVRHAGREQWDEFRCNRKCGVFRYRHRTRKLAKVVV